MKEVGMFKFMPHHVTESQNYRIVEKAFTEFHSKARHIYLGEGEWAVQSP